MDAKHASLHWLIAAVFLQMLPATLLAPADAEAAPLWPESGPGPVGTDVVMADAGDLPELGRAALDLAVSRAAESDAGGLVLVRVPPEWLAGGSDARALLRWVLLFTASEPRELLEAYALAKSVLVRQPRGELRWRDAGHRKRHGMSWLHLNEPADKEQTLSTHSAAGRTALRLSATARPRGRPFGINRLRRVSRRRPNR